RYQIEAPAIGATPAIGAPAIGVPAVGVPAVIAPAIGSSSSTIEIGAVMVRVYSQAEEHDGTLPLGDTPLLGHYQFSTLEKTVKRKREQKKEEDGKRKKAELRIKKREILEVTNALMVDDDVEVGREVNFNAISSEYGDDLLEMEESKNGDEKVDSDEKVDDVVEEEDLKQPTVVTMVVAEVVKTDLVFFNQEEVVGETYQAKTDQTTVASVEEQTLEVEKTEDEASQVVLMKSRVDVTLKKRYALTEEEINEGKKNMHLWFNGRFKIANAWKKKKLSPGYQLIEDQPNANDCGVYMENLFRGVKFLDLIDSNEYRYTVVYDILRLGIQPEEI
ncbi:hypothetical protein GIB67_008747, partial [Kingdonia uniflora]